MAELSFLKAQSGLIPLTDKDKDIYDKWKLGSVISGEFKKTRNERFHRKFFALLNLTFDYWEQKGGFLSKAEREISTAIFKTLDEHNGRNGFFIKFGREFLKEEIERRASQVETIHKSFDVFRKWAISEAGFTETYITPTGVKTEAKSIKFSKMDDLEFSELYKSVFSVCWRFVLRSSFSSELEAEQAADKLLNFA